MCDQHGKQIHVKCNMPVRNTD